MVTILYLFTTANALSIAIVSSNPLLIQNNLTDSKSSVVFLLVFFQIHITILFIFSDPSWIRTNDLRVVDAAIKTTNLWGQLFVNIVVLFHINKLSVTSAIQNELLRYSLCIADVTSFLILL